MKWLIFTSQLPSSPSSLRVMVWRRMKAAGALSLQNGVWLLPLGREQEQMADELLKYLKQQGAEGQSFAATALHEQVEKDLLVRLRAERDEEYTELIERCEGLLEELRRETEKKKFTFAELEENEDELQKLESWYGRIRARDAVGGECAAESKRVMEACRAAMKGFAGKVYAREHIPAKGRQANDNRDR